MSGDLLFDKWWNSEIQKGYIGNRTPRYIAELAWQAARAKDTWISVEDRLPEHLQNVIFVVKSKYEYDNGRVLGGKFLRTDFASFCVPGIGYEASYWMPSPTAPDAAIESKPAEQSRSVACPTCGSKEFNCGSVNRVTCKAWDATAGQPALVFDIGRMKRALSGESIEMPGGLTREQLRQFILDAAVESQRSGDGS